MRKLDGHLHEILKASRVVDEDALKWAEKQWKLRIRPPKPGLPSNLLDALRRNPDEFLDRPLYLNCTAVFFDEIGEQEEQKAKIKYGEMFSIFQNWKEMPRNATLIEFQEDPPNQFQFDGFYTSSDDYRDFKSQGSSWQIVFEPESLATTPVGISLSQKSLTPLRDWYAILRKIKDADKEKWEKEKGCCLRLDRIIKFLPSAHGGRSKTTDRAVPMQ